MSRLRSDLSCNKCGCNVAECRCADRDEALRKIAYDPTVPVMFRWCATCDKHFARCQCPDGVWRDIILSGGREVDPIGLRDITGALRPINLLSREA